MQGVAVECSCGWFGDKIWDSGDIGEWDVCGHSGGDSGGEGIELFLNVDEKCVGGPAPKLLDGDLIIAIELESHRAAGTKRV